MLAQIAAAAINFGMRGPKKPLDVRDLMPSRTREARSGEAPPRRKSRKRREAEMQAENDRRRAFYDGLIARQQRMGGNG